MTRLALTAALALVAGPAPAAVVAVYNSSDRPVSFTVGHAGKPPAAYTLASGETRLVPTGRQPDVGYQSAGKPVRFRLEPYHAYMFSAEKGAVEFHGIDLAGAMPRPTDVPLDPPDATPVRLPVALLADDANPRTRAGWEAIYRDRLASVSEILAKQCGVTLAVASVGDWKSAPMQTDLLQQLKVFEKAAPAAPDTLAIGFTSRYPKPVGNPRQLPTGVARAPLWPYLLVRDGQLRTEPERIDAVLREVGHYLGAAHSPDPLSAMRAKPPEGTIGRYPLGIDPLNLLAVGLWVEELRAGKPRSYADLKPVTRDRLTVVYKTLSGLLPTDELAAEHLAELERVGNAAVAKADPPPQPEPPPAKPQAEPPAAVMPKPVVVEPKPVVVEPKPAPPVVAPKPDAPVEPDRTAAVRKVVTAVRLRAIDLKADPDKRAGDALTVELLMTAADVAYPMGSLRVPAFLIGIGIALDDSDVLRKNLLVGGLVKVVETDAERAERLAALGTPTLRGRRDLCQHFVVSAALAELIGPEKAEMIGLLKELGDRDGVSGFSFADLQADYAGVALARSLTKFSEEVNGFRSGVNLHDFMPPITGLREGLTAAKFGELYGDKPDDPRLQAEMAAVKKRVTDLPKHRQIAEFTGK